MPAQLDWQTGVPKSEAFEDYYFSTDDGLAESDYVFWQHNDLARRWRSLQNGHTFTIAETGFGSGLNFLLTAQKWLETAPEKTILHFISFEKYPMSPADLRLAHQAFPPLATVAEALQANYPELLPGRHDLFLFGGRIHLTLWFDDVQRALAQLPVNLCVDAWYLDGFAPAKNPQMWQAPLFQGMAKFSHANTTIATFTSAGAVRRGLQEAGFEVQKDAGFGQKREMCFGRYQGGRPTAQVLSKAPWFAPVEAVGNADEKTAIIIGAGLAGATAALALAQAGWQVTVLEAEADVANQASGNLAGAIHPLVTADWNLRSQFYLQGLEATLRWLTPWVSDGAVEGELKGLMQLAATPVMAQRLQQAVERVGLPETFMQWQSADQASDVLGAATPFAGAFFPKGGWVRPKSVVEHCLAHPNITLKTGCKVTDWKRVDRRWQVQTQEAGDFDAQILCIATGALSESLHQRLGLPIRPVKGQVTQLPETLVNGALKVPVTHAGYTVSLPQGGALTGATFEAPDLDPVCHLSSHQKNLAQVEQAFPEWLTDDAKAFIQSQQADRVLEDCATAVGESTLNGRIGFRPTTPDHLPIIGAVADVDYLEHCYLQQNASKMAHQYPPQSYLPGLFVSNGHGPRGLMSVFLAADEIVHQVEGRPSLLSEPLRQAVHPARFSIRNWRKKR
jgi:tRNA 5-methylaminomethyl-2-thiouridine biosynthesis bifunctional protein